MSNTVSQQFQEDVKSLSLRFPIAQISKATGFPKSQVSDYTNGKKSPSKNFLQKFYSVYYPGHDPDGLNLKTPTNSLQMKDDIIKSQKETIEAQKTLIENLKGKIEELEILIKGKAGGRRHSG